MTREKFEITLAGVRGTCAGVDRAVGIGVRDLVETTVFPIPELPDAR